MSWPDVMFYLSIAWAVFVAVLSLQSILLMRSMDKRHKQNFLAKRIRRPREGDELDWARNAAKEIEAE